MTKNILPFPVVVSSPFDKDMNYTVDADSDCLLISNTVFKNFLQVDYCDGTYESTELIRANKVLGWFGCWRIKSINSK